MTKRPTGSNADEWAAFLSENYTHDTIGFVAVQIAEAIEESAKQAQICCDSYAAENQRFHDEIERLRAARAWQAIESAPRDGTCFLACTGKWMTVCCWHRHSLQWISCGPTYSPYEGDEMPTHWQYLPEPPPCP